MRLQRPSAPAIRRLVAAPGTVGDEPVWWSSTFRPSGQASSSGRLAHRLRLGGPSPGDVRLQQLIAASRSPALTAFARVATRFAGGLSPYPLLAGLVAATAPAGERRKAVIWSLRRLGAGLGVRFALAQSLRRARPDQKQWLASSTGFSWPSGHTTAITLSTALAAEAALDAGLPRAPVLALALPVPVIIGWSRVYLGVHWPSDVLAGWVLGIALLPLSDYIPRHDPLVAGIRRLLEDHRVGHTGRMPCRFRAGPAAGVHVERG